jgi:hypothetical protein
MTLEEVRQQMKADCEASILKLAAMVTKVYVEQDGLPRDLAEDIAYDFAKRTIESVLLEDTKLFLMDVTCPVC